MLRECPAEFLFEPGAQRGWKQLPVDSAKHLLARSPISPLGLRVHISEPPVAVQREESVGDALEDVLGLGSEVPLARGGDAVDAGQLQVGGDPRQEFSRAEGLDEVVVRSGFQTFDPRFFPRTGREKDHRNRGGRGAASEGPQYIETAE